MNIQKKIASVPADALAAARLRAKQTRQQLENQPGPTELLTSQELADAAPFYLVLRDYIRQLKEAREAAEREIIERVMRKNSGKITAAATELGISRPTLYELLEKLGMAKAKDESSDMKA